MIKLKKDSLSKEKLESGFSHISDYVSFKGKIKNKSEYRKNTRKYLMQELFIIAVFIINLIAFIKKYNFMTNLLILPVLFIIYLFFFYCSHHNKTKIKNTTLLLEKYDQDELDGKIEILDFGIKLYIGEEKIRDISWGNIDSIDIYQDTIVFLCKLKSKSFFISSIYEKKLKEELKDKNMIHLCNNKEKAINNAKYK